MVYKDFLPDRAPPIHEADWPGEFDELRQRALDALALTIGVVGYVAPWGPWQASGHSHEGCSIMLQGREPPTPAGSFPHCVSAS
ncbi:MAG: hypothetical protein ACYC5O_01780 [Anaerolineae bacterium]